jgi:hypothetical protein
VRPEERHDVDVAHHHSELARLFQFHTIETAFENLVALHFPSFYTKHGHFAKTGSGQT